MEGKVQKRLTVTFEDVDVVVHGLGEDYGPTCTSVVTDLMPGAKGHKSQRTILNKVSGQVRPGEMLLVLGRPGSGCTSLLKIISNGREEFPAVHGTVRYGNIGPEQAKGLKQFMAMNTEDDVHFPTLKVGETIGFATSVKAPKNRPQELKDRKVYTAQTMDATLESLGISHTKDTLVGNEFVRGVSGGERKRTSLAEVMSTDAPLQCWDNSTRGLDASNALDFAKVLRRSADTQQKSIVATLYQAGNGIYDQFDKVLVLAEGREIYYGPRNAARAYFEDMGFECPRGANVADFLTSVAVHTERKIRPGFEEKVPNTAAEFEELYRQSKLFGDMKAEMQRPTEAELAQEISTLLQLYGLEKDRTFDFLSRDSSPYHVSLFRQIWACTVRQFQIIWGDRWSNCLQVVSSLLYALVTGSLCYNLSNTTDSVFMRTSALFYPITLFAMSKLSETVVSFEGRPIIARHKRLAMYRPSAHAFASVITDIPMVVTMFSLFHIVFYFMVNFQHDAGKFFTSWFANIVVILCFTSLFRMVGVWCKGFGLASQISGWLLMVMMIYTGYLIPVTSMHPWFRWIWYINPAAYAFNAVTASEMGTRQMECVAPQLVPFGEGYDVNQYQSCTLTGAAPGSNVVDGGVFVETRYNTSAGEIWRNIGIIIAFWVFFAVMTAVGSEINIYRDQGSRVLFNKSAEKKMLARQEDVERTGASESPDLSDYDTESESQSTARTTFTFKNISYFVHYQGQEKQLLQNVSGYVKPGQLVALMGSSGAGKTTLMDALAQRKDDGRIEGSIMINGRPQGVSFQRTTGYCEQNDVHEPTATVWESLVFSARLRQKHDTPDADKLAYVRYIMDLLELAPLQHAIVGTPGSGLSIEERKRLTLAVELVAKPSLLFLDEPTSGLDGQSAYQICRFMRRLAACGQSIICTIHQPSAALFEAFDVLLLLTKGGRTTYFGPTGEQSSIVLDYFARNGAPCMPEVNPAEHIVDVVQGRSSSGVDWAQTWLDSEERAEVMDELEHLNKADTLAKNGIDTDVVEETPREEQSDFASPMGYQIRLVTMRQLVALWRSPGYVWNKMSLHVTSALFGGFTFWMIGNGSFDLQLRLMAVFNFIFVAPGCINQLQPFFLHNRDIFETREKKSKMYHWFAFISSQLLSEIPLLSLCGTLYFACWYFTCGFPVEASSSGQVYLVMILYEFLYTSIAQAIAAYSPNEYFAALANPLILGAALTNFCGVVVPYAQIQEFWRYWMYYINPFTYLIGALLQPVAWDVQVQCKPDELARIEIPQNMTCGDYMQDFISANAGYVVDPSSPSSCEYCAYSTGADYLRTLNITEAYHGWRDTGIVALFCVSSYALVFLMMKLRTKATKKASSG